MGNKLDKQVSSWRSVLLQAISTLALGVVSGVLTQYLCEWLARFR